MYIPPGHIIPELRATERFTAIRELLQHLINADVVSRHAEEPMMQAFRRREEVMSTGVGFGVAIPHITSGGVTEQVLAMGHSSVGVEFAALDGQLVKTVILMIMPERGASLDSLE